jgi:hypothetical protein
MFELKGIPRKFGQLVAAGLTTVRLTFNESLAIAQVEGEGDESTRAGIRFSFGWTSGVTGIAPVVAIPTTAAQWLLWNPQDNPNTIWIDELGMSEVAASGSTTIPSWWFAGRKVFQSGSLCTCVGATIPIVSAASMATAPRGSAAGASSGLIIASGVTLTQAGSPFESLCESLQTIATVGLLEMSCTNRDIKGKISLPPGTGYALTAFGTAVTNTPLYAPHGSYREYPSQNQ